MKKLTAFVGTLVLAMSLLTGCGSSAKTFTVGFDAEFPPYGYRSDNGE